MHNLWCGGGVQTAVETGWEDGVRCDCSQTWSRGPALSPTQICDIADNSGFGAGSTWRGGRHEGFGEAPALDHGVVVNRHECGCCEVG
jgi:hypothetical protein